MFTAKPTNMRKLYALFLKGFKGNRNNLKINFRSHHLLYIQIAPNLKRGPISVDRQLTLA